jgi:hypothetical protein
MRTLIVAIIVAAASGLTGCGPSPDEGAKRTQVKLEESAAGAGLNPSGRAEAPWIDPQKKTVTVLAPPSAPQLVAKQEAQLVAERTKVETHIHDLMEGYASNLRNPSSKAKYQEEIAQQLEDYKRQTLQLYKLQRQNDQANGQPN